MSSEPDAAKRSSPQAADRENSHAGSNAPEVAAEPLAQQVEQFRSEDGGYAKGVGGTSSTYHTFLAGHAYDLLGLMMPQTDRLPAFLRTRQREDGGFAELARTPHSSVNPTCAAVALAVASGAAQTDAIARAAGFLLQSQRADGGWPAGQASPASDLLSTFTAALTLRDMGLLTETNIRAMRQFVSGCRLPSGLYGSSIGDSEDDVEYAFYGLGCEALLLECDREITSA